MTDELVFSNDALSMIGDLPSSMLNDDVLAHDINPSFPQSEGSINIPEIIPPLISPKGPVNNFKQAGDQAYTPITQLMKQTEELASTLDGPLNSSINEQMNFNHMHNNPNIVQDPLLGQHMSNPLVNSSINFVNPSSHVAMSSVQNSQSAQCLVIGGQRIPISAQNQHTPSVINIKHAPNSAAPMIQTCGAHAMHSNSSIVNTPSDMKQPIMMKVPQISQNPGGAQNPNKPPMKGQIVKTPDQRLMFVTEVNGRRVGYLIQQPKQQQQQQLQTPNIPQTPNISQVPISQIQAPTQNVLNQHFDNRSNQEDNTLVNNDNNIESDKLKGSTSEPINFTLDENKEIIVNKVPEQPLFKTDMKSLREKLLNLRNPLNNKNQLNLKSQLSFPSMSKTSPNPELNVDKTNSPSHELAPPSPTLNTTSPLPSPQSLSTHGMDVDYDHIRSISPQNDSMNYEDIEEEEGQEIEFSENDLTAEFDENPTDIVGFQENNEENDEYEEAKESSEDEDCMPLSRFKNDGNESPAENQAETVDKPKKVKSKKSKSKGVTEDNANNDEEDGKSKKKGKSKVKKKKDSRKPKKPIIAYQLFFRDAQKDVRAENPELNFGEISKVVSKKWELLPEAEKKKYHDTQQAAKLVYIEKLKAYKELIAQEMGSLSTPPESPIVAGDDEENAFDDEDPSSKKKIKKGKKRKIVKGVEVKEEVVQEDNNKDDESQPLKECKILSKKLIVKKPKSDDLNNPPSSPSLPSSASSSDAEEEDSESAITRIREKAAELHKYLKQQRFVVSNKKSKQPGKKGGKSGKNQLEDEEEEEEEEDDDEKGDFGGASPKLKISLREERLNVILRDNIEEDNEGTDTADEMKELLLRENPSSPIKIKVEVEEDVKLSELSKTEKVKKTNANKGAAKTKKQVINDDDESSDDDKVNTAKKKISIKGKKVDEPAANGGDTAGGRLRKRKPVKPIVDDDSESEDEGVQLGKKKTNRKKKGDSDSDEEVKFPQKNNDSSPEKPSKAKVADGLKKLAKQIDKTSKEDVKSPVSEAPTPKTDDTKSITSPVENPTKTTFRIPKKSGANNENGMMAFRGPRICIRQSCEKPAVTSRERGGQYCGNECLVLFCREVFDSWVTDREMEEKNKT